MPYSPSLEILASCQQYTRPYMLSDCLFTTSLLSNQKLAGKDGRHPSLLDWKQAFSLLANQRFWEATTFASSWRVLHFVFHTCANICFTFLAWSTACRAS